VLSSAPWKDSKRLLRNWKRYRVTQCLYLVLENAFAPSKRGTGNRPTLENTGYRFSSDTKGTGRGLLNLADMMLSSIRNLTIIILSHAAISLQALHVRFAIKKVALQRVDERSGLFFTVLFGVSFSPLPRRARERE
jgi:hypothetical protein